MTEITLRDLPPELARRIERMSNELGLSLDETVIRLLEERLLRRHHDLDDLDGAWSGAEADEFDANLAKQRRIDRALWD
jgi:hypothetical protein